MHSLAALFTAPYTNEWRENKRFAVQALKNTGFGTQRAEEKINNQIIILMKYLENQNGAAFDPKTPLQNTTASITTSILLNSSPTWGSKRIRKVQEGFWTFYHCRGYWISLHFVNMFIPKSDTVDIWWHYEGNAWLMQTTWEHLLGNTLRKHRDTYDSDFSRDFLDIYQKERRDKMMEEKVFVNTIVDLLPDGA